MTTRQAEPGRRFGMADDRQRFGRGGSVPAWHAGAGEFAGRLTGPELTAVCSPDLAVPCVVRQSGRRARNTYSRLSSVNGSREKPP
jgi:hypothetical protein